MLHYKWFWVLLKDMMVLSGQSSQELTKLSLFTNSIS